MYASGPICWPAPNWWGDGCRVRSVESSSKRLPDVPLLGMLAAVHESAHAVCSYIHHQPIHSIAIEGQNCLGGTFRRHAAVRSIDKTAAVGGIEPLFSGRDRWRQSLIALAAGRAAQRRFGARHEFY
jgi:hypothetical protein